MKPLEYTTINHVNWQKADDSTDSILTDTGQDVLISRYIKAASKWIDKHTRGRHFVPVQQTRSYRVADTLLINEAYSSHEVLQLDDDLLQVITLTNGDSSSTVITASQYQLLPLNSYPKDQIETVYGQGVNWEFANRSSVVTVKGFWGYNQDYGSAWVDTDTLAAAISSTTAATITLTTATGFFVGEYILIDTEIMQISAIDTDTKVLTVTRGANNSTAATHDNASTVYKYQQVPDIETACQRLVNFLLDNRTAVESRIQFAMDIPLTVENKIPGTIWDIVYSYRRPNFRATTSGVWS